MKPDVYRQFYEVERSNWWFAGMRSVFDRQIRALHLHQSHPILDVGCGTGAWTERLHSHHRTIGMDVSWEALSFCRARFSGSLARGSAAEIPFREDSFSLVTAFGVIEHIDDEALLAELFRVCRRGGHVCVLTSAYRMLWSYHDEAVHHKRRYLKSELGRKVRAAGFTLSRLSYVNTILFPAVLVARMAQRVGLLRPQRPDDVVGQFDFDGLLNQALRQVLEVEAALLRYMDFPFGVGLMCIARK